MENEVIDFLGSHAQVKEHQKLFDDYFKPFKGRKHDSLVTEMLGRGLFVTFNQLENRNGILIIGANPSFGKEDKGINFMKTPKELYESPKGYWRKIVELATKFPESSNEAAYLDLFPIKHTKLHEFENAFKTLNDIKAKMLQVTHAEMVKMNPKVIINFFQKTAYYWGFNTRKTNYCNEELPWMGYRFEKVKSEGLNVYRIIGWSDSKESVIANDAGGRLSIGTYIIFLSQSRDVQSLEARNKRREYLLAFLKEYNITL